MHTVQSTLGVPVELTRKTVLEGKQFRQIGWLGKSRNFKVGHQTEFTFCQISSVVETQLETMFVVVLLDVFQVGFKVFSCMSLSLSIGVLFVVQNLMDQTYSVESMGLQLASIDLL